MENGFQEARVSVLRPTGGFCSHCFEGDASFYKNYYGEDKTWESKNVVREFEYILIMMIMMMITIIIIKGY